MRYTSNANRAANVPVRIDTPAGSQTFTVDQRTGGGQWQRLGSGIALTPGQTASVTISAAGTQGYVVADGVRLAPMP
jgi:hypothetical protein